MEGLPQLLVALVLMSCQSIVTSFLHKNARIRGELTISEIAPNIVRFNSTINGTCVVTHKDESFNISGVWIADKNGRPLKDVWITSTDTVEFLIPNIKKDQFGAYKCIYYKDDSRPYNLVRQRFIHVVDEPLEVQSIRWIVYNWDGFGDFTMTPSLEEQDMHTHDANDRYTPLKTMVTGPKQSYNPHSVGIKVWTRALGEPEEYSKVFRADEALYVKPSPVQTINATVRNETCISLWWPEDGMWKEGYETLVQYSVNIEAKNFYHVLRRDNLKEPGVNVTGLIPHGRYVITVIVRPLPSAPLSTNGGLPSEPKSVTITMPDSVPARNPSLIGYSVASAPKDVKRVTLFWKRLPEIDKNGRDVLTQVELDGDHKCETDEETSCRFDMPASSENHIATIYSTSRALGRNTSAPLSSLTIGTISKDSQHHMNVEVCREVDGTYNVTWAPLQGEYGDAKIVKCDKSKEDGLCKDKPEISVMGEVKAAAGFYCVNVSKSSDGYKFGIVLHGGKYKGLIRWSPCLYDHEKVPPQPKAQVDMLPETLMVFVQKYTCDAFTETSVKVSKISGRYCQIETEEKPEDCNGDVHNIDIIDLGEWKSYPVTKPGLYQVSLVAESAGGKKSKEWTSTVSVTAKGTEPWLRIALPIIGVTIVIIVVIVLFFCRNRLVEKVDVPLQSPDHPPKFIDTLANPDPIDESVPTDLAFEPIESTNDRREGKEGVMTLPKLQKRTVISGYTRGVFSAGDEDLNDDDDESDDSDSCESTSGLNFSAGTCYDQSGETSGDVLCSCDVILNVISEEGHEEDSCTSADETDENCKLPKLRDPLSMLGEVPGRSSGPNDLVPVETAESCEEVCSGDQESNYASCYLLKGKEPGSTEDSARVCLDDSDFVKFSIMSQPASEKKDCMNSGLNGQSLRLRPTPDESCELGYEKSEDTDANVSASGQVVPVFGKSVSVTSSESLSVGSESAPSALTSKPADGGKDLSPYCDTLSVFARTSRDSNESSVSSSDAALSLSISQPTGSGRSKSQTHSHNSADSDKSFPMASGESVSETSAESVSNCGGKKIESTPRTKDPYVQVAMMDMKFEKMTEPVQKQLMTLPALEDPFSCLEAGLNETVF